MEYINRLVISTGYPRWLVILCVGLAVVAGVWVLAKMLKWTLLIAFGILIVVLFLFGLLWLLG